MPRRLAKTAAVLTATAAAALIGAGPAAAHPEAGAPAARPAGDTTRSPLDIPVNMCGGTVGAAGLLSPAFGGTCAHGG